MRKLWPIVEFTVETALTGALNARKYGLTKQRTEGTNDMKPTVTIKEETERTVYTVETLNTAMQPERYSVIQFPWNGQVRTWMQVEKDGKNGKKFWSSLDENRHRHQWNRIMQIIKDN